MLRWANNVYPCQPQFYYGLRSQHYIGMFSWCRQVTCEDWWDCTCNPCVPAYFSFVTFQRVLPERSRIYTYAVFDLITAPCAQVLSQLLGKLVVKYVSTYTKGTLKKDQRRAYLMILMRCFYSDFLYKAYVVATHLNCIDKSMQFKWVTTTYAFTKKSRQKLHWLYIEDYGIAWLCAYRSMCRN